MPDRTVVSNSTPIIALLSIGRMDILKAVYGEVFIPEAVRDEVTVKDAHALNACDWLHVKPVLNKAAKEAFATALHIGEVETMLLAKEMQAHLVIIDDGLARKHAKYLGLNITGTIGVILRARREGIIPAVKPLLEALLRTGFFLSDSVQNEVLRLVGESKNF